MLRLRRYKSFLIFAVFVVGALYYFGNFDDLPSSGTVGIQGLRNLKFKPNEATSTTLKTPTSKPWEEVTQRGKISDDEIQEQGPKENRFLEKEAQSKESQQTQKKEAQDKTVQEDITQTIRHEKSLSLSQSSTDVEISALNPSPKYKSEKSIQQVALREENSPDLEVDNTSNLPAISPATLEATEPPTEHSQGRLEVEKDPLATQVYWIRQPEQFSIPLENIIQLPTGKPRLIPKIQHTFADESANEKIGREQKLNIIKKTFEFSWAGYKEKAWMQDELSPVSGNFRNPFCGWAASLVDTLDTLWIMGMKEEFEEAVNAVKDIDFTTTMRNDIPLFETVIRYLGGLLSAYDLSKEAYRILLDKAVELAEILMGAFDTPNRMPMTFYLWKP